MCLEYVLLRIEDQLMLRGLLKTIKREIHFSFCVNEKLRMYKIEEIEIFLYLKIILILTDLMNTLNLRR